MIVFDILDQSKKYIIFLSLNLNIDIKNESLKPSIIKSNLLIKID